MKWLRRLFRRELEPVAEIPFRPRAEPAVKQTYRYSVQSGTYCDVLRALSRATEPVTAAGLRAVLGGASTVPVILGQMRQDGIVSVERVTVRSRIGSYKLTDVGRAMAVTLDETHT